MDKEIVMDKEIRKTQLISLLEKYKLEKENAKKENISEETIRGWLNDFLRIFGWDIKNTNEVIQEKKLSKKHMGKLAEIESTHSRPDYTLVNGSIIKTFIDAKDLKTSILNDSKVAFQIRSYGWSAEVPCAFVSNFEELGIYDCGFIPCVEQEANLGRIYLTIDQYIDNFDILDDHLLKTKVFSGRLIEIYEQERVEGKDRLDEYFTELISEFRIVLAKNILENNKKTIGDNHTLLNYYVQVIMDRIIFLRVCESRGIEEAKLKYFLSNGFWKYFSESCYMDFYEHYDGALFERDNKLNDLIIDDKVFENFIDNLYYPSPYKFDVIPVRVIANIYEQFLAKQLLIASDDVKEMLKEEYIKSQGAVSTPKHIVESICKNTIKFDEIKSISEILNMRILDPCMGSGHILVYAFDVLYQIYLSQGYSERDIPDLILDNNIYGLDIDERACQLAYFALMMKARSYNRRFFRREDVPQPQVYSPQGYEDGMEYGSLVKVDELEDMPVQITGQMDFEDINFEIKLNTWNFRRLLHQKYDVVVTNPPYMGSGGMGAKLSDYVKNNYPDSKADTSTDFMEKSL
ncbi:MAG: N-6 DNA methylase, partial [Dysgonamonadaceae bacterium]|nr:N-6 DNA methylase [Dysgonamonadaceae bacterium]